MKDLKLNIHILAVLYKTWLESDSGPIMFFAMTRLVLTK